MILVGGDVDISQVISMAMGDQRLVIFCVILCSILWLVRNFCGFTTGCWSTDPPHIAVHQGWVTQWPRQQSWKLNRRPSHVRCLGRCWCFMFIYSYRYSNIQRFHRFLFAFPCCSILPCAICSLGKLWSHHYSGMKVVNAREEFSRFVWLGDLLKTYAYALPVDCVSPTFDHHDCGLDQDLDDMCVKTSNEVSLACTWWRVIRFSWLWSISMQNDANVFRAILPPQKNGTNFWQIWKKGEWTVPSLNHESIKWVPPRWHVFPSHGSVEEIPHIVCHNGSCGGHEHHIHAGHSSCKVSWHAGSFCQSNPHKSKHSGTPPGFSLTSGSLWRVSEISRKANWRLESDSMDYDSFVHFMFLGYTMNTAFRWQLALWVD